jgi:hypothetical protein
MYNTKKAIITNMKNKNKLEIALTMARLHQGFLLLSQRSLLTLGFRFLILGEAEG